MQVDDVMKTLVVRHTFEEFSAKGGLSKDFSPAKQRTNVAYEDVLEHQQPTETPAPPPTDQQQDLQLSAEDARRLGPLIRSRADAAQPVPVDTAQQPPLPEDDTCACCIPGSKFDQLIVVGWQVKSPGSRTTTPTGMQRQDRRDGRDRRDEGA